MGHELLRKSGMKNLETQTEFNKSSNSNFKLKRLRKVRGKGVTREQASSENTLTGEKCKTIWRVYSHGPPPQGQVMNSTHNP